LAKYQLLTQYVIEESLCDAYNRIHASDSGDDAADGDNDAANANAIVPNDFYLSVSFFFNFCLSQNCPDYGGQKRDNELWWYPHNIDSDTNFTGYKMYATFESSNAQRAQQMYDVLTQNENALHFMTCVEDRARRLFNRGGFRLDGIAVGDLPQRARFVIPQYITWAIFGFIGFCTLFSIVASIHGFVIWNADCIRMSGIVYFALYTWDFYSDIVFDLELLNYEGTRVMFGVCTAFIIIPWIANIASLSRYQQLWCKDDAIRERVYSWFVSWQRLIYVLAALSGSAYGTIELANSYFFGLDFFSMGLNERHLKRFNNNRLWSGILAENLPQLCIQIWFMSTINWKPENDYVWLTMLSSALSIGAALLDIYSAKKLFDVIDPKHGRTLCSMYLLSQEIKEHYKRLQITLYALRDAVAETLGIHARGIEMHFPILMADGFRVSFTVFSDELQAKQIYESLRKNVTSADATIPPELPRRIKKAWNLQFDMPRIPIFELKVDGVDISEYDDFEFWPKNENEKHHGNTQFIELADFGGRSKKSAAAGGGTTTTTTTLMAEHEAIAMMDTFKSTVIENDHKQSLLPTTTTSPDPNLNLNSSSSSLHTNGDEYEAKMAALNAQIAMNQYLMMKQMEFMKQEKKATQSWTQGMQQLMGKHMQRMMDMIAMNMPYQTDHFAELNQEWQQQQEYQPPNVTHADDDDGDGDDGGVDDGGDGGDDHDTTMQRENGNDEKEENDSGDDEQNETDAIPEKEKEDDITNTMDESSESPEKATRSQSSLTSLAAQRMSTKL